MLLLTAEWVILVGFIYGIPPEITVCGKLSQAARWRAEKIQLAISELRREQERDERHGI
jgi:hypothetical protein